MINYAHRGASEYAPENTLSAFYLGLLQGANGIETDVRKTKDGELVLFHDKTLDRVTDACGNFEDYTWEELKQVKVFGNSTLGFYDRIVSLREFLEKFSSYEIRFAIELKAGGIEKETLEMVKEFGVMNKTTFTGFQFDYVRNIKELDPAARVGWLTRDLTDEAFEQFLAIGGDEFDPKADLITEDLMKKWRGAGVGVRAWGVTGIALMKKMCQLGVDGMTVNFPDRLNQYLSSL